MVGSPVPLGGVQLLLLLLHLLHLLPLALLPASPNLQCQSVLERVKIRVGAYICQSGKTFQVLARFGSTWNVSRLELTGSREFCQIGIHSITVKDLVFQRGLPLPTVNSVQTFKPSRFRGTMVVLHMWFHYPYSEQSV